MYRNIIYNMLVIDRVLEWNRALDHDDKREPATSKQRTGSRFNLKGNIKVVKSYPMLESSDDGVSI